MAQEGWWLAWCSSCVIATIILTLVTKILIKIGVAKKEEGAGGPLPGKDVKFCLKRCVSNNSEDSGFGRDENSSGEYAGIKIRGKTQRINNGNEPIVGKLRVKKISTKSSGEKKILKGPVGLPFIGCLHLLGGSGGPFEAFNLMSRKYGEIYSIRLGSTMCIVVSSYRLIKEVLGTKGTHFAGRPNLLRFDEIFDGDRNNSLALCDWSDLHLSRRSLARGYCSPRSGSAQESELGRVATTEMNRMIEFLKSNEASSIRRGEEALKPLILATVSNMFTHYMCSISFSYGDDEFRRMVRVFDEVFWQVNQGHPIDFLPWLRPFYTGYLKKLRASATDVHSFILEKIVNVRRSSLDIVNGVPRDFTDALLLYLERPGHGLSWNHVIFELEDLLGGHSAIGNLAMLILAHIVKYPEVQRRIQEECDAAKRRRGCRRADLADRSHMPYTEAVILETLRISSSPIVPHVATQDTEADGYSIPKDTVVLINNYDLNLSEAYWGSSVRDFCPERFLVRTNEPKVWRLLRPAHFIPFSTGKRTCVGQRFVQSFTFAILAALFSHYSISATENATDSEARAGRGSLAMPPDTFHLILTPRTDEEETSEFVDQLVS